VAHAHLNSIADALTLAVSVVLCMLLLPQFNNPLHLWQLWDPEIRQQRRCIAQHDALMSQKVHRLRKDPPAPHTIAGVC
jgi:hypothetical protein